MDPGLSSWPALINMHYNLAQGAKLKGYPINQLKEPLGISERLNQQNSCNKTDDPQNLVCAIGFVLFFSANVKTSWLFFYFFGHTSKNNSVFFMLLPTWARTRSHSPLYRSQTHFYSSGYLYGNEGQRVSFYFIFLSLLITTVRRWRRNTSCVSR